MSREFALTVGFFSSILDDIEMYEQQTPFELVDYIGLSYFLNNFLYKTIQDSIFGEFDV